MLLHHQSRDIGLDHRIAVGGIEYVPVAGGQLGRKTEQGVPQHPHRRHGGQVADRGEAIALGIVGLAQQDGRHQLGRIGQVHLVVAIHLDQHLRAAPDGLGIAGQRGTADALILLQANNHDTGVGGVGLYEVTGLFGARIIDADDAFDPGRRFRDHPQDVVAHLVAGHNQPDACAVKRQGVNGAGRPGQVG
jgi:hypothetical protein